MVSLHLKSHSTKYGMVTDLNDMVYSPLNSWNTKSFNSEWTLLISKPIGEGHFPSKARICEEN